VYVGAENTPEHILPSVRQCQTVWCRFEIIHVPHRAALCGLGTSIVLVLIATVLSLGQKILHFEFNCSSIEEFGVVVEVSKWPSMHSRTEEFHALVEVLSVASCEHP